MSYEEKSSWIMGVLAVVSLTVYLSITLVEATMVPLAETNYVPTMFWTIIGSIVVTKPPFMASPAFVVVMIDSAVFRADASSAKAWRTREKEARMVKETFMSL